MAFSSLLAGSIALLLGIYLLYPVAGADGLKSLYLQWTSFTPWSQTSVNAYLGTISLKAELLPVPVIACLLGLSLFAYALFLLLLRGKKHFNWRVVATLTIVCWISLDLLWQTRLLLRLHDTHRSFAGMGPVEKLAAAPDKELFTFIERVKQKVDTPNRRFFLSTSDDYFGVRGSYHLYPENVYWKRHAPELPNQRHLRRDDYIVVIPPTEIHFDDRAQALLMPGHDPLPVEPLIVDNTGVLFRVK